MPKQQRILNSNMRAIINTLGRDKLQLKGSRVNIKEYSSESNSNTRSDRHSERDVDVRDRRPTDDRETQGSHVIIIMRQIGTVETAITEKEEMMIVGVGEETDLNRIWNTRAYTTEDVS